MALVYSRAKEWACAALLLLLLLSSPTSHAAARPPVISRRVRYLLFPPGSNNGIECALSIPVQMNVNVALNIEANYPLPSNVTELYPEFVSQVVKGRSAFGITRRRAYATIESIMNKIGLAGRGCLLRAICEAAETSLRHNGLVGDLLHILFTPSSSESEELPTEFDTAELTGKRGGDCRMEYPQCPSGIFQLFTALDD